MRKELSDRAFSLRGESAVLRDRLVRALLRDIEPDNDIVPWYPWDATGGAVDERVTEKPAAARGIGDRGREKEATRGAADEGECAP